MNKKNKSKTMLCPNLPLAENVSNIYEMDDASASIRMRWSWFLGQGTGIYKWEVALS